MNRDLATRQPKVKTYSFKVALEQDGDAWRAYWPALEQIGGATWGTTREEALKHINEVVQMIVRELQEDGEIIPGIQKFDNLPAVSYHESVLQIMTKERMPSGLSKISFSFFTP